MVDVKTVGLSVVAVLYVFLQPGIRAQPTIGSSSEDDPCSQLEEEWEFQGGENLRLRSELEREWMTIKTLTEENQRLRLENKRHSRGTQPAMARLIHRLDTMSSLSDLCGITKVEDMIYLLDCLPNRIRVLEDRNDFSFIREIALNQTGLPFDIVYSNKSKCVYISVYEERCIWVMKTTGEHRLTTWLTNVSEPNTLSFSNEGHVMVLRHLPSSQLDIYSLNATLIRRLQLPEDVKNPRHVVQTSAGNFIILHQLNNASTGPWVISQLTNDEQLIHRFIPRNKSEELNDPQYLFLDSDNNRLFVADYGNHRVILFDSCALTWSQVLLSREMNGRFQPSRLFYDASKKHLFVAQDNGNVTVHEIN